MSSAERNGCIYGRKCAFSMLDACTFCLQHESSTLRPCHTCEAVLSKEQPALAEPPPTPTGPGRLALPKRQLNTIELIYLVFNDTILERPYRPEVCMARQESGRWTIVL